MAVLWIRKICDENKLPLLTYDIVFTLFIRTPVNKNIPLSSWLTFLLQFMFSGDQKKKTKGNIFKTIRLNETITKTHYSNYWMSEPTSDELNGGKKVRTWGLWHCVYRLEYNVFKREIDAEIYFLGTYINTLIDIYLYTHTIIHK